jgi:uncharacterized protein (TIGR03437 family)
LDLLGTLSYALYLSVTGTITSNPNWSYEHRAELFADMQRYVLAPEVTISAVVSAANGLPALAPGSLAAIYGTGLSSIVASNISGVKPLGASILGFSGTSDVGSYSKGVAFTVPSESDCVFTGGSILVEFEAGINSIELALRADSGGMPGPVLESMMAMGVLIPSVQLVSFSSATSPVLVAGRRYWLTAATAEGSSFLWWDAYPQDFGLGMFSHNGGPWQIDYSERGGFRILGYARAGSAPLSTKLGGVTVSVGGRETPLLYLGGSSVYFQVPYETPLGSSPLLVKVNGTVEPFTSVVSVTSTAPGIFVHGDNWATVQNEDRTLNGLANPAAVGSHVTAYCTGLGAMSPAVQTGAAAPVSPPSSAATNVTASINGVPARVVFAGLTPGGVGLSQVNVEVPVLPSGIYELRISAGGVTSNGPSIAIR